MDQLLVFPLGGTLYGLALPHIQEVVEEPALHYIPRAPAVFCGALNFHGSVLPVIDLAALLGLGGTGDQARVLVLATNICRMALAVASVRGIVRFCEEALAPPPAEAAVGDCIRALVTVGDETVHLLDPGSLLARLGDF